MTFSPAAHGTRRALAGLGIVAASILVVAPVASAERPGTTDRGPAARSAETGARQGAPVESQDSDVVTRDTSDTGGRHEQTLCHRTGSAADPYVQITVAFHTVDGEVVSSDGGHESHDGPAFDHAGEGDTWGDIIPPFTTPDGASFEGQNWPAGRATFENGCEPAAPAPDIAPAPAPASPAVGEGDGAPDDGADAPGDRRDERGDADEVREGREEQGTEGRLDEAPASGRSTSGPRTPRSGTAADVVDEGVLSAGGATGDIAAVLGQQVVRDARGEVVPSSGPGSAIPASLARTDSDLLVLLMLGLSVLVGGYAAVDAIRDRVRRTR